MSLPELQQNPLVQRVIDIFDEDGNGEVDFKGPLFSSFSPHFPLPEFIRGISQFSVRGEKGTKLKCEFRHALSLITTPTHHNR